MVHCLPSIQPHPDCRQNIPVCLPGSEVPERNPSGLCQFHFTLQRQEPGENIRKTEPSPDTSAECGALPELHPDNMTGHIGKQASEPLFEQRTGLQLTQGYHCADTHPAIPFLDLIQAQAAQINERADALPAQTQPAASAQDRAAAFPVEFQCLLQCGRTHISLCCKQSSISPLF